MKKNLEHLVKKLFKHIDANTKEMWDSNLESTSTCVQIEDTEIPDIMQEIEKLFLN